MANPTRRTFLAGGAGLTATATAATFAAAGTARAATWETVVGPSSFASYQALEADWNYLYPWGSDHNGSARMFGSPVDHNHVHLADGVLTLQATRISGSEGNSGADPHLPIRYHSGAVHLKHHVVVDSQFPEYEIKGDFAAPGVAGTWPALWLTAVNSWPPEIDIVEFKGDNRNCFNTARTSSDWSNTVVSVSNPEGWHSYRAWITKVNDSDVETHFYLDGQWRGAHRGTGFVGKPLWLIYNLQMEGSSGGNGPGGDTYFRAKNIYVGRNRT